MYDQFVEPFVAATGALVIGDGTASQTQVGPPANPRQLANIEALIADAVERGATVLAGGQRLVRSGYFSSRPCWPMCRRRRVMHEEPFGPIAVLLPFDTLADGLAEANRLTYALSA